jgi:hypothetical protein
MNVLFKLRLIDKMTVCIRAADWELIDLDNIVSLTDDPWYLNDYLKRLI